MSNLQHLIWKYLINKLQMKYIGQSHLRHTLGSKCKCYVCMSAPTCEE